MTIYGSTAGSGPGSDVDQRAFWRRYQALRHELFDYSTQQLVELGISEADLDFVTENASRG
jgi:uncharacterized protein YjiS (DUF1127 family)